MAVLGMPNPALWGVVATVLNFIPYIGALVGIVMVGLVALISFDFISFAIMPTLVCISAAVIEGQLITPVCLAGDWNNSVAIFIFVAL